MHKLLPPDSRDRDLVRWWQSQHLALWWWQTRNVCLQVLSSRRHLERHFFFLLGVLFEMKTFWSDRPYLIRNHLSFFFFVSVFCSQIIYPRIKFTAKNLPDLCNFYSKVIFWNFCLSKYFLLFFAEIELFMFHNTIVSQHYCENFRKKWTSVTCWKSASKLPTQPISI